MRVALHMIKYPGWREHVVSGWRNRGALAEAFGWLPGPILIILRFDFRPAFDNLQDE
jgi:hypothetical protein